MREIKFRSWDNRNKVMDFPDNIANDIDGEKYQIMQYTGLGDKNGKEIYEGDIVREDFDGDLSDNAEVRFIDCAFRLVSEDNAVTIGNNKEYCLLSEACTSCGVLEVIGNIYENPELLKGK